MKKYLIGLVMNWGNFTQIPCPFKKWNDDYKNYMISWLPLTGVVIGGIWVLVYYLLNLGNLIYEAYIFSGLVMTLVPFLLSGMIHMDGFMDVSDAVGSYGDIEKRKKILKDSHVGSNAVIKTVLLVLAYFCGILTGLSFGIEPINLIIIPMVPRAIAGLFVLLSKKMDESGYKDINKEGVLWLIIQLVFFTILALLFSTYPMSSLIIYVASAISTIVTIIVLKKKLGGMNGDIAGCSIMVAETISVLMFVIC